MDTLTGDRLYLRRFQENDLPSFYAYARHPEVGPMAGWKPHTSIDESRAILQDFIASDEVWAIVRTGDDVLMGSIGLHQDRKRGEVGGRMLGYVLGADYWGRGYMTEAARLIIKYGFEEQILTLISVYHYPHNTRSRRVIEKLGFVCEGTLRRASLLPSCDIVDDVCYSMTREEYKALYKQV